MLKHYFANTSGAVTVEYALVGSLLSLTALKSLHCITIYCLVPTFGDISAFFQATGG